MSLRNLALVIAPNLFGPPSAAADINPMEELVRVEVATNALHRLARAAMDDGASAGATKYV